LHPEALFYLEVKKEGTSRVPSGKLRAMELILTKAA
jgi:hypothetical protein